VRSVVVVTGMSGAGRSTVAEALEDAGWFVVDNVPLSLVSKVLELASQAGEERLALVVGRPYAEELRRLSDLLDELRDSGVTIRVVFVDAEDDVLVARFEATKRPHPLGTSGGLAEAIATERRLLEPARELADAVVDTSELSSHELRARVNALLEEPSSVPTLRVVVTSFGFKYGTPRDLDLLFDVRFLPNPYWRRELRALSGLEAPVRDYVLGAPDTAEFLARLEALLGFVVPRYVAEGRAYLHVGVGCTGGRHRSVVIATEIAAQLARLGVSADVRHRDVERAS
jgi:UPF0042 nucleotide-binding protein